MTSFNPDSVRQAVAEFTPRRPQRFHELSSAKDVIAELRQKRASYRSIADFLTQHCLPVSKSAVAAFCHEVLGEVVRPRRRPGRKRGPSTASPKTVHSVDSGKTHDHQKVSTHPPNTDSDVDQPPAKRSRGPRIAHVRMATPPKP